MGIAIFFILCCVIAFILVLIYTLIMKYHYKSNNNRFSSFSVFAWSIFLFFLCNLLLPWIFSISSWLLPLSIFYGYFFISFHNTFRVIRHYKILLLMLLSFLLCLYYLISTKQEKDWLYAENFFSKNFPDENYARPQPLDKKYFHFITRDEMKYKYTIYEKDLVDLKTGHINPILVPNIVNLQKAFFNFEKNTVYLNNKAYTLKDNEIYILECSDLFNDKKLQNLFKGKKILCMANYFYSPFTTIQKDTPYQNILTKYALQNIPSKSSYSLQFLLNVQPYMYSNSTNILKDDILFVDIIFSYKNFKERPRIYYNPKLKTKNFCPVTVFNSYDRCIDFRKLFIPVDNKETDTKV